MKAINVSYRLFILLEQFQGKPIIKEGTLPPLPL